MLASQFIGFDKLDPQIITLVAYLLINNFKYFINL